MRSLSIALLSLLALLSACTDAEGPGSIVAPGGVVEVDPSNNTTLGDSFARALCGNVPLRFKGTVTPGATRVIYWLQGDQQGWLPTLLLNPEPTAAYKLVDVAPDTQGNYQVDVTLLPHLGDLPGGGYLALQTGRNYGLIGKSSLRGGPLEPYGGYTSFTLPNPGCIEAAPHAQLTLSKAAPCLGEEVTLSGSGFEGDLADVQAWERTATTSPVGNAKEPPVIKNLGQAPIDAQGQFAYGFRLTDTNFSAGHTYTLMVFDQFHTRSTSLPMPLCQ